MLFKLMNENTLWDVADSFQVPRGLLQSLVSSACTFASCLTHFTGVSTPDQPTISLSVFAHSSMRNCLACDCSIVWKREQFFHLLWKGMEGEWLISNSPCSLAKSITSHSMKNSDYADQKMIKLPILTTSHIHLPFGRLGECTFWTWE